MVKISADQGVKNSLTEAEYKEVKEIADKCDMFFVIGSINELFL